MVLIDAAKARNAASLSFSSSLFGLCPNFFSLFTKTVFVLCLILIGSRFSFFFAPLFFLCFALSHKSFSQVVSLSPSSLSISLSQSLSLKTRVALTSSQQQLRAAFLKDISMERKQKTNFFFLHLKPLKDIKPIFSATWFSDRGGSKAIIWSLAR